MKKIKILKVHTIEHEHDDFSDSFNYIADQTNWQEISDEDLDILRRYIYLIRKTQNYRLVLVEEMPPKEVLGHVEMVLAKARAELERQRKIQEEWEKKRAEKRATKAKQKRNELENIKKRLLAEGYVVEKKAIYGRCPQCGQNGTNYSREEDIIMCPSGHKYRPEAARTDG